MPKHSGLRRYLADVLPEVNPPPEWAEILGDEFVLKEIGKGLSTNDYTTEEKEKLTGLEPGGGYEHPSTHPATMITEDTDRNFVTSDQKNYIHPLGQDNQDLSGLAPLNHDHTGIYEPADTGIQTHVTAVHAPANAQANNISDINAGLLTGGQPTTLHTHAGGSGDPWHIIKLTQDFVSSLAANTNVTGFNFTPAPNKTYLIFGYFLLRTATATVGARPGILWPSNLIDATMRMEASTSLTASVIRTWGLINTQNATSTGLATTADSHWGSLDGIMITAANVSGNFQITIASETAGTNVTMKAGSILMYREL